MEFLRTLRILNLPEHGYLSGAIVEDDVAGDYIETRLKNSAKDIFDVVSKLKVLSFGMKGVKGTYDVDYPVDWEQQTYVRADVKDIGGRMSVEAY